MPGRLKRQRRLFNSPIQPRPRRIAQNSLIVHHYEWHDQGREDPRSYCVGRPVLQLKFGVKAHDARLRLRLRQSRVKCFHIVSIMGELF